MKEIQITCRTMEFDGNLLRRGFWLYLWKIASSGATYLYVGRTGDSSSPNAASPFNRIGQHLDFKPNAKGNAMARNLKAVGIDPRSAQFRMVAFGPIFPEQEDFERHRPLRDQMATLEHELAQFLRDRGYSVLGKHHRGAETDPALVQSITTQALAYLQ